MTKKQIHIFHGHSDHPLYKRWHAIRQRCESEKHCSYPNYGGRGIKLCDRWQNFGNFLEDMGMPECEQPTIERIDNDGDYTPENCKWVPLSEQSDNRRCVHRFTIDGVTKTRKQWCEEYGMSISTFRYRIRKGWDVKDALTRKPLPIGMGVK